MNLQKCPCRSICGLHLNEIHFNGHLKSFFFFSPFLFFLIEIFLAVEFILIGLDL